LLVRQRLLKKTMLKQLFLTDVSKYFTSFVEAFKESNSVLFLQGIDLYKIHELRPW